MAEFRYVPAPASGILLATQAGIGIAPIRCQDHDELAVSVDLEGTRVTRTGPGTQDQVGLVVPRCVLASSIGSLLAQIDHYEGANAARAFLDAVHAAQARAQPQMADLARAGRDCCDAGFRTGGREHTCRTTATAEEGAP